MKRMLFIVTMVFIIISAIILTPVLAKDNQNSGTPFEEVWAAIDEILATLEQQSPGAYGEWVLSDFQLIPPNTWTKIAFDRTVPSGDNALEGFDLDTHKFTAPATGIYNINVSFYVQDSGDGDTRALQIYSPSFTVHTAVSQQPLHSDGLQPTYSINWTGRIYQGWPLFIRIYHDSLQPFRVFMITNLHIAKFPDL